MGAASLGPAGRISAPVVGPFWLSMVWNRGVSFGVLNLDADWTRCSRWALSAFSIVVAVSLAVWARRQSVRFWPSRSA